MRRFSCLCLAAGWVLLQAGAARAVTLYVDDIRVDENGNGTYDVQDLTAGTTSAALPLTVLNTGSYATAPGLSYQLPYPINVNENSNQWLVVNEPNAPYGAPPSDLVWFHNDLTTSGTGVLTFYSNDSDGDKADVSPTVWSTIIGNADGYSVTENTNGAPAFYSTYVDTGGVPGDPAPHPALEAYYYLNSAPVPEPSSFALALAGLASGILLMRRHRLA